jgi:hypothetical protein
MRRRERTIEMSGVVRTLVRLRKIVLKINRVIEKSKLLTEDEILELTVMRTRVRAIELNMLDREGE